MGTNIAINNGLIIPSNNRRKIIPKAIRDAMVLWYDIKRQGATNETMSANPILKDHSGNGHDATCYNFAWNTMSGIGDLYPNALVTDGIDDYAISTGLPLLTPDNGFTVIAKRELLEGNLGCLVSKRNSHSINGAFLFECQSPNGFLVDSFNGRTYIKSSIPELVSYMTMKDYNGITVYVNNTTDTDNLRLFVIYNTYFAKVALYSFLLFNRNLTLDEIEWVKKNLIEGDNIQ